MTSSSIHITIRGQEGLSWLGWLLNPFLYWAFVPLRNRLTKRAPKGPQKATPPAELLQSEAVTVTKRPSSQGWDLWDVAPSEKKSEGRRKKRRIIYIHGGAYIRPVNFQHWKLARALALECDATVTMLLYPLLPDNTAKDVVPHLVDDVYAGVRRDAGPDGHVVVMGDSAGGNLALVMTHLAFGQGDQPAAAPPDYALLISPVLDCSGDNPEIEQVAKKDPWLRPGPLRTTLAQWRGTSYSAQDVHVSPLFGDFDRLAKAGVRLGLVIGTHDILEPDCRRLREKAGQAEVEMDVLEWQGMPHVFPLFFTFNVPESIAAVQWMMDTLKLVFRKKEEQGTKVQRG